jgi:hypothetical protein
MHVDFGHESPFSPSLPCLYSALLIRFLPAPILSFFADESNAHRQTGDARMAKEQLVVIGGDAAGMSAASVVRRRRPEKEIIVFERGPHTSYSA